MRALEWLRDPLIPPLRPVYAVHGNDLYLARESTAGIIRTALGDQPDELAVRRFEGSTANLSDVLDELRTLPFFSRRRVAIVQEADPFVTRNRADLESYVEAPSDSGVLVLLVRSWPASTRLAKLVAAAGLAIDVSSPAEKELVPWLIEHASRQQSKLENDAARLLLELVGPDVGVLAAEVEKLAVYVGASGRIRREDVSRMVEAGRIESIWKVLDAATTGQCAQALTDLDDLVAAGEHPIKLLAGMAVSLLKLHHAGSLRAARVPLEDACRIAGLREFAIEKTRRQHAHLGPARVSRLPAMLLKADLDIKGNSLLDPRIVLEDLIVRLALPRHD